MKKVKQYNKTATLSKKESILVKIVRRFKIISNIWYNIYIIIMLGYKYNSEVIYAINQSYHCWDQ